MNKPEPRQAGDVVGRTLASFIAFPGHVGYYDGSNIYQVMNEPQVVQYVSVANFKATVVASQGPAAYWGAGYPNIPFYYVKGCFEADCRNNAGQVLYSRAAMNMRAYQIWRIGAIYTLSTEVVPALPADATHPLQRGKYRCDTYVLDIYRIFTAGGETDINGNPIQSAHDSPSNRWRFFVNADLSGAIFPAAMFDKLKNFRG